MCTKKGDVHLAIDAIGVKHGGGASILLEMLGAVILDSRFRKVSVFCSPRGYRSFDVSVGGKVREIECGFAERTRLYRLWWLQNRLPTELRRYGADVLLCMTGISSGGGWVPHVTFIQQSLPFFPEALARLSTFQRLRMSVMFRAMKRSCMSSRQVIVQTPTMKQRVAEAFRIPPASIVVSLPAVSDLPKPVTPSQRLAVMRDAKPELRLLYVGNAAAYKNVNFIVSIMERLRARVPGLTLFLTWPADHSACRMSGVVGLGYLRGAELQEAYELATVLVMPSLAETVGLPMMEAMNVGTPVLAADRPYAHDICEDAAVFFDPLDAKDFAAKVATLLRDECLRQSLVCRGHNVVHRRQTERSYARMLDIIANVACMQRRKELHR